MTEQILKLVGRELTYEASRLSRIAISKEVEKLFVVTFDTAPRGNVNDDIIPVCLLSSLYDQEEPNNANRYAFEEKYSDEEILRQRNQEILNTKRGERYRSYIRCIPR